MPETKQSSWVLVLIGCGKLLKALMLVVIALEIHHLLHRNVASTLEEWVRHARIDPGNHRVHALIARITGISPDKLRAISLGSFIYAALFATEGIGLILRQTWAEYLTVISTSLLLPLEVYEIVVSQHHRGVKIVVMLLNLAVVIYLIYRLWKNPKEMPGNKLPSEVYTPVTQAGSAPISDPGT